MMYFYVPVLFYTLGLLIAFIALGNLAGKLSKIINNEGQK